MQAETQEKGRYCFCIGARGCMFFVKASMGKKISATGAFT